MDEDFGDAHEEGRRRYACEFGFDNPARVPHIARTFMHCTLANSNCNYRLAITAMWSFAVVEISKRNVIPCKQERT